MAKFKEHFIRKIEKFPKRIFFMLFLLIALAFTTMAIYFTLNEVLVTDSLGNNKKLITTETSPVELMSLSGITSNENDKINMTKYTNNIHNLNIQRAFPVTISVDGKTLKNYMTDGIVSDALEQVGIVLNEHDYTEPSLHTPVSENTNIIVHRVVYRDTVVQEDINFETEYQYTSLLHLSQFKYRTFEMQEGINGTKELTFRERIVDGNIEQSKKISEIITKDPQNSILMVYKHGEPVSSIESFEGIEIINNAPSNYKTVLKNVRSSAYSSRGGRGSSGLGLYAGTVAVNPNIIPYGTKLFITSPAGDFVYGFAIATDTGSSLMSGIVGVDLYYETYLESVLNEIKHLNIYILE